MIFFDSKTERTIESADLIRLYGTNTAIPQLGICELAYQPTFTPVGFRKLSDGTYLPVQSNATTEIANLVAAGYTESAATQMINE